MKRTLHLEIGRCRDCPYLWSWRNHCTAYYRHVTSEEQGVVKDPDQPPPQWCPLPEANEAHATP